MAPLSGFARPGKSFAPVSRQATNDAERNPGRRPPGSPSEYLQQSWLDRDSSHPFGVRGGRATRQAVAPAPAPAKESANACASTLITPPVPLRPQSRAAARFRRVSVSFGRGGSCHGRPHSATAAGPSRRRPCRHRFCARQARRDGKAKSCHYTYIIRLIRLIRRIEHVNRSLRTCSGESPIARQSLTDLPSTTDCETRGDGVEVERSGWAPKMAEAIS